MDAALAMPAIRKLRPGVIAQARGATLEIGFGSGLNLPFYRGVSRLYALEPSRELYALSLQRMRPPDFEITPLLAGAEEIPLPAGSVDTVVSTFTACSIQEIGRALREIRRVLKPGGIFLFLEHGLSRRPWIQKAQRLLSPVSSRLAGGCRLDRDIARLVTASGLDITGLERFPLPWQPLMEIYSGTGGKHASSD